MKTINFKKTTAPAFEVEVAVNIEDTIATMLEPGYERIITVMETEGLSDDAIIQGLDLTKKIEMSYQGLIKLGKDITGTVITVTDNASSQRQVLP